MPEIPVPVAEITTLQKISTPVTDSVTTSGSTTSSTTVMSLKTDKPQEKITQWIKSEGPCPSAGAEVKPALATVLGGKKKV